MNGCGVFRAAAPSGSPGGSAYRNGSPVERREVDDHPPINLVVRLGDPERGNKLSTWLGMLASHTAYDFLRGARREPRRAQMSEAEDLSSTLPDPCESALLRERAVLVSQLLAHFSDKDRAFIQLYFGEGLAAESVAERLNISIKTVYSKKHKIQARLQTLLSEAQLAA